MTLTESLVSSFLLMLFAGQSGRVFTYSMEAAGKTKIRDQIALSISSDLEHVRNQVNLWKTVGTNLNSNGLPLNGEMSYEPTAAMCLNNTLAKDLLNDNVFSGQGILNNTESETTIVKTIVVPSTDIEITRTISSEAKNYNLLNIHYKINAQSLKQSDQRTTLMMPAQAWCP